MVTKTETVGIYRYKGKRNENVEELGRVRTADQTDSDSFK
jgi:hypothetical protein